VSQFMVSALKTTLGMHRLIEQALRSGRVGEWRLVLRRVQDQGVGIEPGRPSCRAAFWTWVRVMARGGS
jgi:hypothetical protein